MSGSLDQLDATHNSAVPPTLLRQTRTALTSTWGRVSFAVEVLALDLAVLNGQMRSDEDHLQAIIDNLPGLIAGRWDTDGWLLPIDTPDLFAAADADGLLDLHRELACSDIDNPHVAHALSVRMTGQRSDLLERKNRLEMVINQIREILLLQYSTGAASTDDWLESSGWPPLRTQCAVPQGPTPENLRGEIRVTNPSGQLSPGGGNWPLVIRRSRGTAPPSSTRAMPWITR